jgi:DNA-binding transcriptional LysR family regulator
MVEIRHLRYFLAVAAEKNFSRAAEKLNIAQPPLSQQIKHLESELGVSLIHRETRPVRLTEAGIFFSEQAKTLVNRFDQLISETQKLGRAEEGSLTIGFVGSATCEILPKVLRQFRAQYSGIELRLHEMTALEQRDALHNRDINVGFLRPSIDDSSIKTEPLLDESIILACPSEHPLAMNAACNRQDKRDDTVSLKQLNGEPLIFFPRGPEPSFGAYLYDRCRELGLTPRIVQETGEVNTALSLVAGGIGIALMPESIKAIERAGVAYLSLKRPAPTTVINVAYRRDDTSPALKAFLAIMREALGLSVSKKRKGGS